ncbi:cytochrome P450 [Spirillospora sp. NPDC048911]|uniref:cytochrome P450 n=1 Tax=Spirillospora sp. NPDC048911 TaxID=3364527 RepID=UPI00371F4238
MSQHLPFTPDDRGDPPAEFAERRLAAPLAPVTLPNGNQVLVAVRYEDVRQVLGDPRFTRIRYYPDDHGGDQLCEWADIVQDAIQSDEVETVAQRAAIEAMSPRNIRAWRPYITELAEQITADFAARAQPGDFMEGFAFPLVDQVLDELLGIPAADRARVRHWSDVTLAMTGVAASEDRMSAGLECFEFAQGLVRDRQADRAERSGGHFSCALIDSLIDAHAAGDLSEAELDSITTALILGGRTAPTTVGGGVFGLLSTPGAYRALVDDPAGIPQAVEEILRCYTGGVAQMLRMAREDVRLPSGTVQKGQTVLASTVAANFDPQAFADPDRFDIDRAECPHLGLGHGAHYCVGANLGREMLQTGLTALTSTLPGLRLAVPPDQVQWFTGLFVRYPTRLPLTW